MPDSRTSRRGASWTRGAARLFGRAGLAAWRLALLVLFILGGIAVGGFLNFVHQVQSAEPLPLAALPKADAVVVLTGGPRRIDAGLDLLGAERGARMLVTGVNEATSSAALENVTGEADDAAERARLFDCCIDLGREARDTVGNAVEARDWIRARGYRHVIVVTADFHMPRSLLEFRRALKEAPVVAAATVESEASAEASKTEASKAEASKAEAPAPVRLTPWPVLTPDLRADDWYTRPQSVRRMLGEWIKYLSAQSKGWFGAELLKEWFPTA